MTNRFYSPFQQFFDSTPTPRSGARLFFYAAGTATKQNTYSNTGLSIANDNPLTLNALGQPDTDIFLSDASYKVVLAPAGSDDPPNTTLFSADNYYLPPTTAKFNSGSGSPNGSVAGTAGSAGVPADAYLDYTAAVLYVCTTTGTSSTAVWTAINLTTPPSPPQGRLTPTSATPVISTGVTAATSVYYTPHVGNRIPIYDGAAFANYQFSELTLSLVSSHAANSIYDVFVFLNNGTVTVGTGPVWSNVTFGSAARGTGAGTTELTRVQGVLVNNVAITARNGSNTYAVAANKATYVGTILIDSTQGQITCHLAAGQSRRWGIWNAYNRIMVTLICVDGTASWTTTSSAYRAANNDTNNNIVIVQGQVCEAIVTSYSVLAKTAATGIASVSIGINAVGFQKGIPGKTATADQVTINAHYEVMPALGGSQLYAVERNDTNTITATFYGSGAENFMQLNTQFFA